MTAANTSPDTAAREDRKPTGPRPITKREIDCLRDLQKNALRIVKWLKKEARERLDSGAPVAPDVTEKDLKFLRSLCEG